LGERIVVLERTQRQLAGDREATSATIAEIETEINSLNEKVNQQGEWTQRFETFLKELQFLLYDLL
jgi:hypothetical protein